jgi:hypothetical protein
MQESGMALSGPGHRLKCHLSCCHHQELFVLTVLMDLAQALALALAMPPFPSIHVLIDERLNS